MHSNISYNVQRLLSSTRHHTIKTSSSVEFIQAQPTRPTLRHKSDFPLLTTLPANRKRTLTILRRLAKRSRSIRASTVIIINRVLPIAIRKLKIRIADVHAHCRDSQHVSEEVLLDRPRHSARIGAWVVAWVVEAFGVAGVVEDLEEGALHCAWVSDAALGRG